MATQVGLDFSPRPARRPRAHAAGRNLKLALSLLLHSRHQGRASAASWETLRDELVAEGMPRMVVRRLQEAAEELLEDGTPIVGLSSDGVWLAETAEEIRLAVEEATRRAKRTLRRRTLLRRAYFELLGQERLRGETT